MNIAINIHFYVYFYCCLVRLRAIHFYYKNVSEQNAEFFVKIYIPKYGKSYAYKNGKRTISDGS